MDAGIEGSKQIWQESEVAEAAATVNWHKPFKCWNFNIDADADDDSNVVKLS